ESPYCEAVPSWHGAAPAHHQRLCAATRWRGWGSRHVEREGAPLGHPADGASEPAGGKPRGTPSSGSSGQCSGPVSSATLSSVPSYAPHPSLATRVVSIDVFENDGGQNVVLP